MRMRTRTRMRMCHKTHCYFYLHILSVSKLPTCNYMTFFIRKSKKNVFCMLSNSKQQISK